MSYYYCSEECKTGKGQGQVNKLKHSSKPTSLTLFVIVVVAPMIMKFGTAMKLDVTYTMATKECDVTTTT